MEEIELNDNTETSTKKSFSNNDKQSYIQIKDEKNTSIANHELILHIPSPPKSLKYGKLITFYYVNGEPKFCLGPHWPLFSVTLSVKLILCCLFIYYGFEFISLGWRIIGVIIMVTQLTSYILTAITNPGIPKREMFRKCNGNKEIPIKDMDRVRWCEHCDLIMNLEENTRHCYDCEICIEGKIMMKIGYDHHCPWTSKCIGKNNIRLFYIFIISTLLLFGYLFYGIAIVKN